MHELDPGLISKIRELSPQDRAELALFVDFLRFKAFFSKKYGPAPSAPGAGRQVLAARLRKEAAQSGVASPPVTPAAASSPPLSAEPALVTAQVAVEPAPSGEAELIAAYALLAQGCLADSWDNEADAAYAAAAPQGG